MNMVCTAENLLSAGTATEIYIANTTHDYYYCYTIWLSLVTGLFCLVLLLNQRWSPTLRLQASHCSTFRIMCDVPSIAVFVVNLSNVFMVQFPNFSLIFSLLFQWLQLLLVIIIIIIIIHDAMPNSDFNRCSTQHRNFKLVPPKTDQIFKKYGCNIHLWMFQ